MQDSGYSQCLLHLKRSEVLAKNFKLGYFTLASGRDRTDTSVCISKSCLRCTNAASNKCPDGHELVDDRKLKVRPDSTDGAFGGTRSGPRHPVARPFDLESAKGQAVCLAPIDPSKYSTVYPVVHIQPCTTCASTTNV